jgi:hypothetical protein
MPAGVRRTARPDLLWLIHPRLRSRRASASARGPARWWAFSLQSGWQGAAAVAAGGWTPSWPRRRIPVVVTVQPPAVILHVHVVREPGSRGGAHVDIFRLENGKVAEHWDVDEPIPADIANPHGPF